MIKSKYFPNIPETPRELYKAWEGASQLTEDDKEDFGDELEEGKEYRVLYKTSYLETINNGRHSDYLSDLIDIALLDSILVVENVTRGEIDIDYVLIEEQEPFVLGKQWEDNQAPLESFRSTIDSKPLETWKELQKSLQKPYNCLGDVKFFVTKRNTCLCFTCAREANHDYVETVTRGEKPSTIEHLAIVAWVIEPIFLNCDKCSCVISRDDSEDNA